MLDLVGSGAAARLGALAGQVLAVARPVDVDAQSAHGQAIEDCGGENGIAEVAPPVTEPDVGGQRRRGAAMPTVDEVEEGVRGGGLVVALSDLAQTHVVDDQELRGAPASETSGVGAVGKSGAEVIEQVDAAGIAGGDLALAGAEGEGLQEVLPVPVLPVMTRSSERLTKSRRASSRTSCLSSLG